MLRFLKDALYLGGVIFWLIVFTMIAFTVVDVLQQRKKRKNGSEGDSEPS